MARGRYGWIRDNPDPRDQLFAAAPSAIVSLPVKVDLRSTCPPVYDQGQLGSCTANAIAGALQFDEIKGGNTHSWTPSRLFVYYNERALEGTTATDSGAQIRDGIKVVNRVGVCPEAEWPYDISKFTDKPPAACYADAKRNRVVAYQRVAQLAAQMRACLAEGFPFVFGFTVFESFESTAVAQTGVVPMPASDERPLGGHAVSAVGYDDGQRRFIVRNSWGAGWGEGGYCHMPYEYLSDPSMAADFWTVRSAPGGQPLGIVAAL